ncbi:MAG TPA: hypothetical protein DCZ03_06760 [Gammaproteobacteria bacterium]|nr:hypothetical protein [Gammaproteobacteria bacterium]
MSITATSAQFTDTKPQAKTWMYIPYLMPMSISFFAAYLVLTNSAVVGWGLIAFPVMLAILEPILGKDENTYEWKHSQVFVYGMYVFSFFTFATFIGFLWVMAHAHNGSDLLGIAAMIQAVTGFDMIAAHQDDGWFRYIVATLLMSITATLGTVGLGHELCHRTHEPLSVFLARGMGALNLFSYYAIEHPYGHHLTAATPYDSSTALRGESIPRFIKRTFIQDYQIVQELEQNRLNKLGTPNHFWKNKLYRGFALEALLVLVVFLLTGALGLLLFAFAVVQSHVAYKAAAYIQHYGLVRDPNQPIEIHHSWGCNYRVTNWLVDGIGRHADHHDVPEREFWDLLPHCEGPQLPGGYLKMWAVSRNKRKWEEVIAPILIEWDNTYASPEEKRLAMEANKNSGIPLLVEHAKKQQAELAAKDTACI